MASEPEPTTSIPSEIEEAVTEQLEVEDEGNEIVQDQVETNCDGGEDYTPLSSNEDPEKQAAYRDYKILERNIKHQNKILEDMKGDIQNMECKPYLTIEEMNNLKTMRDSWERESKKLENLRQTAMKLQNEGSRRHYREITLATTADEDNLNDIKRTYKALHDKTGKTAENTGKIRVSAGESSEMNTSCKQSQMSLSEERELMRIFEGLQRTTCPKECEQHKQTHPKENDSLEKIKSSIKCMQQKICKLNEYLKKKENHNYNHLSKQKSSSTPSCCKNIGKANTFQQLKDSYLYLLTEFNKKDEQLKELSKRLKNSCSKCISGAAQGDFASADESELHLLRNRINEMNEEQVEFKCLMKEQSFQLEEYRNKYLTAQQKVEEQAVLMEKLNLNNKCIEKQINQEIKEIRAKFQERLADLLQYPKLLENEQIKLSQACKENENLENKLVIVCKELKTLKAKYQNNNVEDCKPQLNKCQQELCHLKKDVEKIQQQRDMFCEQLKATTEDLNTLRSESAKIIARTKERAEFIKQQQQNQIDRLEKQLAQCRATACLSVSDREHVIKEMQGQLNTLSYSFDSAQKQIKTLRNHIAFMSNENTFPVKC